MKYISYVVLFLGLVPLFAENLVQNSDLKKFNLKTGNPAYWNNSPTLSGSRSLREAGSEQFVLELAATEKKKNAYWIGTLKKFKSVRFIYLH